jgi:antitoxin MazE
MKTRIVRIGNSQGIRIPKLLIEQTGLSGEVEISVHKDSLVIRRATKPREGWREAFAAAPSPEDDAELEDFRNITNEFDEKEWEWR